VKLLVQPGDSVAPFIKAIKGAKKSIEILIFRFDRREIETALVDAVSRGVFVHALIAYTNNGGEMNLRRLETRLLAAGATVARTADDLLRYHGKMMIIDRRELHLFGFNLTYNDIERSRSFGVVTTNSKFVQEAVKLFEADTKRQPYTAGLSTFLVSPVNARKELFSFLKEAKRQLLIYDPKISDPGACRLLDELSKAGVEIRIIGRFTRESAKLPAHKLTQLRLHTRTIVRDGRWVFIGSQSLRSTELDARREIGIIFRDTTIAGRLTKIFERDWLDIRQANENENVGPVARVAKKTAKAVTKSLPPVVREMVREVVEDQPDVQLDPDAIEEAVKTAVKKAVRKAVQEVVEDVVGIETHRAN
jgi:phosphatidylserine/phosphatidylglycerophosphate/cardiolipin synthase-like enzyme